jgi:uncharacterized membrane protein
MLGTIKLCWGPSSCVCHLSGSFRMSYITNFLDTGSALIAVMTRAQPVIHSVVLSTAVLSLFRWLSISTYQPAGTGDAQSGAVQVLYRC